MFRFAIITAITLRVMLCPLYCGGGTGIAHVGGMTATVATAAAGEISAPAHCGCSGSASATCDSDSQPAETPAKCPGDKACTCVCFCHAMSGVSDRSITLDVAHSLDLAPAEISGLDVSKAGVTHHPIKSHRLGLDSGRSIRLAFSSLLI